VFVDPGRDRDFKAPVTCTAAAWDRKTRTKDDDEDDKRLLKGGGQIPKESRERSRENEFFWKTHGLIG
jgi:hypothetical protein